MLSQGLAHDEYIHMSRAHKEKVGWDWSKAQHPSYEPIPLIDCHSCIYLASIL